MNKKQEVKIASFLQGNNPQARKANRSYIYHSSPTSRYKRPAQDGARRGKEEGVALAVAYVRDWWFCRTWAWRSRSLAAFADAAASSSGLAGRRGRPCIASSFHRRRRVAEGVWISRTGERRLTLPEPSAPALPAAAAAVAASPGTPHLDGDCYSYKGPGIGLGRNKTTGAVEAEPELFGTEDDSQDISDPEVSQTPPQHRDPPTLWQKSIHGQRGRYYLVDSDYAQAQGYLGPHRNTRYWKKEFKRRGPEKLEELGGCFWLDQAGRLLAGCFWLEQLQPEPAASGPAEQHVFWIAITNRDPI
ncbi:hypothetical protein C2845_PM07G22960 [Panicum miliaceum]|uniref:Uncharacterized protein n=1 Tax=Panicum miliaceum TaxID=4540 RepID=A0A3L6SJR7_PANMI|nr:hypothetical protein C2845_PM07G22960 [Panicum miliaceum]